MGKLVAAAVVSTILMATGASANHRHESASDHTVVHKDPKDVENKLDIKRVIFRGRGDGDATLVMKTRKRWGCKYISGSALDDGGVASIRWAVNKNKDVYTEREAYFGCNDDGWMLHWGTDKTFEARRPDRRTLKVTLPLDDLGLDHKKHLKFIAVTFANGMFGDDLHVEETDASTPLAPLADNGDE
jgi:hypothetical protein